MTDEIDETSETSSTDTGGDASSDGAKSLALDRRGFIQTSAATAALVAGAGQASAGGYSTTDLRIDSFDGTELAATLYTPDEDGTYPAIVMTHGWGSDRTGDRVVRMADNYASSGYVVLTYDSRGFGESDGEVGLNGPNEVEDVSTLIDWLTGRDDVEHDGAGNPVVGMDGYSYSGAIQLLAAANDDRIQAIAPDITWNDLEYSTAPNGVVKIGWLTLLLGAGAISTWEWDSGSGLDADLWSWYLGAALDNELPEDAQEAFADRSVSSMIDQVDAPTLVVHAWDDTLFNMGEAIRTYRSLQDRGVETSLVVYEGGHSLAGLKVSDSIWQRVDGLTMDWMDRHLKGTDVSIPQSTLYLRQPGVWREDDQFPPEGVEHQTLDLSDARDEDYTHMEPGWWWWQHSDYAFRWVAGDDLEICGSPEFDLWVYNDGPESRVFFEFYHVYEDGGRESINNLREAVRVEGEGYQKVEFTFPAIQRFVPEDDYLEMEVSITDAFHFDSREHEGTYIMHTDEYPSSFTLPYHNVGADPGTSKDFEVGDRVHFTVDETSVRHGPGTGYSTVTDKQVHTSGEIVGGPVDSDGSTWWEVLCYEDDEGVRGWAAQKYLDDGVMTTERLSPGDRVTVDTGDVSLHIRDGPSLDYESIDTAPDGAEGRIIAGPEWNHDESTEFAYWKIDYDDNETGWSAQDFLERE